MPTEVNSSRKKRERDREDEVVAERRAGDEEERRRDRERDRDPTLALVETGRDEASRPGRTRSGWRRRRRRCTDTLSLVKNASVTPVPMTSDCSGRSAVSGRSSHDDQPLGEPVADEEAGGDPRAATRMMRVRSSSRCAVSGIRTSASAPIRWVSGAGLRSDRTEVVPEARPPASRALRRPLARRPRCGGRRRRRHGLARRRGAGGAFTARRRSRSSSSRPCAWNSSMISLD